MSGELLNVDPTKQGDRFYRYKMPPLTTKVEGNGNGIKTVLPNIEDVCKRINRNPEYVVKYFGTDCGATTKLKDLKWIITGVHEKAKLQKALFDYITKFVLCKACRNPETITLVDDKRKSALLRCSACGEDSSLDPCEKIMNIVLKNEPLASAFADPSAKKAKKKKKDKEDKEERRASKGAAGDVPGEPTNGKHIMALEEYLQSCDPPPSSTELTLKLGALKTEHGLKKKELARVASRLVFAWPEGWERRLRAYAPTLKKYVSDSAEKHVLEAVEWMVILCAPDNAADHFPSAPEALLEAKVISPEGLLEWYEMTPMKTHPDESTSYRQLCGSLAKRLEGEVDNAGSDES